MKNLINRLNENGVTLIELLVSITLLSIVIISFLSFFGQSMKLSLKVEDKLSAVNVAEIVLDEVRVNNSCNFDIPQKINGKSYYPKVECPKTNEEIEFGLKLVHIQIYRTQDFIEPKITEIYGYIELSGKD